MIRCDSINPMSKGKANIMFISLNPRPIFGGLILDFMPSLNRFLYKIRQTKKSNSPPFFSSFPSCVNTVILVKFFLVLTKFTLLVMCELFCFYRFLQKFNPDGLLKPFFRFFPTFIPVQTQFFQRRRKILILPLLMPYYTAQKHHLIRSKVIL